MNTKKSSQTGSSHIVVVIILVVALIGALGFIFWQNFVQKDQSSVEADNPKTNKQVDQQPQNDANLTVTEWDITIPKVRGASYTAIDKDKIKVKNDALRKAETDIGCDEGNGVVITRQKSSDVTAKVPYLKTKDLNGYTYLLQHGNQGLCIDDKGIAPKEVNDAYEALHDSLADNWQDVALQ